MNIFYKISRNGFEIAIRLLFRMSIIKKAPLPEPPFIVAANHASLLDPPLVGIACKHKVVNFVVKQELVEIPVIRHWTRHVECVPVKRGDNSIKGLREALRRIKQGKIVGMFPEGTRSTDGTLQEAKVGTGFLISNAKVPVVPIYSFGTSEALPKGKGIKFRAKVGAIVGKAIMPEEIKGFSGSTREKYDKITNLVMERIGELEKEARNM